VDALQREADSFGVALPPNYDFSFAAQRPLVQFAPGSLDPLAVQLGEVKLISEILFATRINALDGIQRVRVSDDDAKGPQADYVDEQPVTNGLAVVTPYVVTFRCFTPELSRVLAGFAASPNAFVIKSANVQPAGGQSATPLAMADAPPQMGFVPGMRSHFRGQPMPVDPAAAQPAAPVQNAPGKGGLQMALKEQLLRVTLEVEHVKLLPKS
jgi:hypothetical protein